MDQRTVNRITASLQKAKEEESQVKALVYKRNRMILQRSTITEDGYTLKDIVALIDRSRASYQIFYDEAMSIMKAYNSY